MQINYILTLVGILFLSCGDAPLPKPRGELRLSYPDAVYVESDLNCPYSFEYSRYGRVEELDSGCWLNINYTNMKARIYITYQSVNGDLAKKIKESERLAHEHSIKASFIAPQEFMFPQRKVYGTLFELGGETALNFQFHATDSVNHLVSGSAYFEVPPNPDSLRPAVQYIKKDIRHFVESLTWN